MFDKIINNESYPYSKRRLKYYSLAFKDAEDKIRNGVNPDDVHKDLIKMLSICFLYVYDGFRFMINCII